ncbi:MAG: hypothetical protein JXR97_00480 [Planctomycetes bacterium]|nr:hypothetical protein [Planctomycetota bacterium]
MFEKILGQEEAVRELREEMSRNRLNHAYLFEGPEGVGRCTLARAFAAVMLYGESATTDPDNHPDYLELPRDATSLRIRRFVEREGSSSETIEHTPVMPFLQLRPVVGERRICLIPDAERMEISAANTFLKTLEEPPGKSMILLTTSARDRMLPTIVSRCRRVRVCPLPENVIADELVRRGLADETHARDLALISEGSLGTAIQFASGEIIEHWNWIGEAMSRLTPAGAVSLAQGMIQRAASAGSNGLEKRRAAGHLLDLIALHVRKRLREGTDPRAAAKALSVLWRAGEQLSANVRMELVLNSAALDTIAVLRASA